MSGSIPEKSATVPTNNSPSIIYTKRQSNRETKTNKREREKIERFDFVFLQPKSIDIYREKSHEIKLGSSMEIAHIRPHTRRDKNKKINVSYFVCCPLRNNKSQVWLTHKDGRAVVWWIVRTDALAIDLLLQDIFTFLFGASQMKEKKKKIEIRWKRTI